MISPSPRCRKRVAFLIVGVAAGLLAGCDDEPIRTYRVPRPEERLLGVIVPHQDETWFIKLKGPTEAIADTKAGFDQIVRSLRFSDKPDQPLQWTLPDGWKEERSRERMRHATFRSPLGLEVTVTRLPDAPGSGRLTNINRWRGQIGLPALKESDLDKETQTAEVAGVKNATLVDMTGTPGKVEKVVARRPIEFETPAGWERRPPKSRDQFALFRAGAAEISITRMEGEAGGAIANFNRWRQQVGLDVASAEQLQQELKESKVGGETAMMMDAAGEVAGSGKQRVVGAICARAGATWFFKMMGPADAVEAQRAAFDTMIKSVRFAEEVR